MSNHPNGTVDAQPQSNRTLHHDERQPLIPKISGSNKEDLFLDDNDTESEAGRQEACRGMSLIAFSLFLILITLRYATSWFFHTTDEQPWSNTTSPTGISSSVLPAYNGCPDHIPFCRPDNNLLQVKPGQKGIPSFWDYAPRGAINVTYDGRSFLLNQERALFLSGSMHPIRATKQTWENSLNEMVRNGLNMVTIYVFWAEHQPLPHQEMDWTLPAGRSAACQGTTANAKPSFCGWSLADAIRAAAQRGLFVHIRIGPYVCAEYNYGGIPEWVALHEKSIQMRRLEKTWLDAMEKYVSSAIDYLTKNKLFAFQGGPIVAAQIENELGEDKDDTDIPIMDDDMPLVSTAEYHNDRRGLQIDNASDGTKSVRKVTVQDYADWCGALVERLAPNVIWTMCNGLSAQNTILSCNGACSTTWLEDHGGKSGRIQVDQPAMWSEDEGGFQIWGDDAKAPSDYFWGRTARAMAFGALRWFARGGTHLNYYMFWGSYNRGRASAAGIMNAYATDAPVCPSGQPRQPKFGHFQALHRALHQVASILLETSTALNTGMEIEYRNESSGEWEVSGEQRKFVYRTNFTTEENHEAVFVENASKSSVIVRLVAGVLKKETITFEMSPSSAVLVKDGAITFDSFSINTAAMAYERQLDPGPTEIFGWSSCAEPIGALAESATVGRSRPVEQTSLNIDAGVSSDYAWYETEFMLDASLEEATILVESQKGSAMVLFLNQGFLGEAYNHQHAEGNITFQFRVGPLSEGPHKLAILSESLGYHNLIGRWGSSTAAKVKGITGDVIVAAENGNQSLVDNGFEWKSSPGLNGAKDVVCRTVDVVEQDADALGRAQWTTAHFHTPVYDPTTHSLFLNITRGRGHVWLNGHDLGRFWNITRGNTESYSQQFYFLPLDFLDANGGVNKLVFFDALGDDLTATNLLLSWLDETNSPNFQDVVDYPQACI